MSDLRARISAAFFEEDGAPVMKTDRFEKLIDRLVGVTEPERDSLIERMIALGHQLHRATMIGKPPPAIEELRERMLAPQKGDLVLEVSSLRPAKDPDSIGVLEMGAAEGTYWKIRPLRALHEVQGWDNATFVALPPFT